MNVLLLVKIFRNVTAIISGLIHATATAIFFCLLQWIDALNCLTGNDWLVHLGVPKMTMGSSFGNALGDAGHSIAHLFGEGETVEVSALTKPALLSFLIASILAVVVSSLLSNKFKIDLVAMFGTLVGGAAALIVGMIALWILITFIGLTASWALVLALFLGVVANVLVFGGTSKK
ncbi:MAG: hypothetical protein RSD41_02650 [Kiritimatiellia bacterium]